MSTFAARRPTSSLRQLAAKGITEVECNTLHAVGVKPAVG